MTHGIHRIFIPSLHVERPLLDVRKSDSRVKCSVRQWPRLIPSCSEVEVVRLWAVLGVGVGWGFWGRWGSLTLKRRGRSPRGHRRVDWSIWSGAAAQSGHVKSVRGKPQTISRMVGLICQTCAPHGSVKEGVGGRLLDTLLRKKGSKKKKTHTACSLQATNSKVTWQLQFGNSERGRLLSLRRWRLQPNQWY